MKMAELVALAFEHNPTAVVLTDSMLESPGPHILYVNQAFCAMIGYSKEEVIGRNPRILQGNETSMITRRKCRNALMAGQSSQVTFLNYRKNGEPYGCDVNVHPLYDETGKITHFISFESEKIRKRGRPSKIARAAPLPAMVAYLMSSPG